MLNRTLVAILILLCAYTTYMAFYKEPIVIEKEVTVEKYVVQPPPVDIQPSELAELNSKLDTYKGLLTKIFGFVPAYSYTIGVEITGASARPEETDNKPWYTADSTLTRVGILGLSRDLIKNYGAKYGDVVILGDTNDYMKYGIFHVNDTISDRFEKRANIIMAHPKAAKLFGLRKGVLTIVRPVPVDN